MKFMLKLVSTILFLIPIIVELVGLILDTYYLQKVTDGEPTSENYLTIPASVYRTMAVFIYLGLFKTILTSVLFIYFLGQDDEKYVGLKLFSLFLSYIFQGNREIQMETILRPPIRSI